MIQKIERPFGRALARIGGKYENMVVIDADLKHVCDTMDFSSQFPDRYFDVGVAEANMIGIAAGLALSGKTVFCGTFSCFITQRVYDQVAISIAYMENTVKLCGFEPALTSGGNGATHQSVMDLALMRSLPNMRVYDPVDAISLSAIMEYEVGMPGPAYIRGIRKFGPAIIDPHDKKFQANKAFLLRDGRDVTLIASGIMLERAMQAADKLAEKDISARVVALSCLKPIDSEMIENCINDTGCLVTAENHTILGGLGSAVAEVASEFKPVPVIRVGIRDVFGEVGDSDYLAEKFHIGVVDIVNAAEKAIDLKNNL